LIWTLGLPPIPGPDRPSIRLKIDDGRDRDEQGFQMARRSSRRFGIEILLVSFCNQINMSYAEMILSA
jgi:hypothetical protein